MAKKFDTSNPELLSVYADVDCTNLLFIASLPRLAQILSMHSEAVQRVYYELFETGSPFSQLHGNNRLFLGEFGSVVIVRSKKAEAR